MTIGMSKQEFRMDVETMKFPRDIEVINIEEKMFLEEQKKEGNEDRVSVQSYEVDISEDTKQGLDDAGKAEQEPQKAPWWPSDSAERLQTVSLGSKEETLSTTKESPKKFDQDVFSSLSGSHESGAGRFDAVSNVPELSLQTESTSIIELSLSLGRRVFVAPEKTATRNTEHHPPFVPHWSPMLGADIFRDYDMHKSSYRSDEASTTRSTRRGRLCATPELIDSTWRRVLESAKFDKKPLFPYREWYIAHSELSIGTRVGISSFGEVYRSVWNGADVAIKVLLEQDLTAENMDDFCNEISILSRIRHPNVILFLGASIKPPQLSMVTEYMEMGSLFDLTHSQGRKKVFTWRRKINMLRDICKGLMCIHRMKIVHGDINSANCLVNKRWIVKICGFGLSKMIEFHRH